MLHGGSGGNRKPFRIIRNGLECLVIFLLWNREDLLGGFFVVGVPFLDDGGYDDPGCEEYDEYDCCDDHFHFLVLPCLLSDTTIINPLYFVEMTDRLIMDYR